MEKSGDCSRKRVTTRVAKRRKVKWKKVKRRRPVRQTRECHEKRRRRAQKRWKCGRRARR